MTKKQRFRKGNKVKLTTDLAVCGGGYKGLVGTVSGKPRRMGDRQFFGVTLPKGSKVKYKTIAVSDKEVVLVAE